MRRAARAMLRGVGWLLTPLIVAGAAFMGLWAGAQIGKVISSAIAATMVAIGLALVCGMTALYWWIKELGRVKTRNVRLPVPQPPPPSEVVSFVPYDEAAE